MAARIDIEGGELFNTVTAEVYRVQSTMPEAMASVWDQRKWDGFRQEIDDAVLLAPSSTLHKINTISVKVLCVMLVYLFIAIPYIYLIHPFVGSSVDLSWPFLVYPPAFIFGLWQCVGCYADSIKDKMVDSLRAALEAISAREHGLSFHLREEKHIKGTSKGRPETITTYFIEAQWGGALPPLPAFPTAAVNANACALAYCARTAASHTGAVVPTATATAVPATAVAGSSSAVPMGTVVAGTAMTVPDASAKERVQQRLATVQELRNSGVITQQEFDDKRGQLLALL